MRKDDLKRNHKYDMQLWNLHSPSRSLQTTAVVWGKERDQEGVPEHGESRPASSFPSVYSACVAGGGRSGSDGMAWEGAADHRWQRVLLSWMGRTGSPPAQHALGGGDTLRVRHLNPLFALFETER